MRTISKVTVAIALVAICFAFGAWTAMVRGWGDSTVTTKIVNEGDQALASVTIRFKSCGAEGTVTSHRLEPGSTQRLRYSVCGEGGYSVTAVFMDGRAVTSVGGYVESGYRTTERVGNDAIMSTQALYAL